MCDCINKSGDKIPIIDGQPRNLVQYELCKEKYFNNSNYKCIFINLWAPKEVRIERAANRDKDILDLKLSLDRMDGDSIVLFDILSKLSMDYRIFTFDTTTSDYVEKIRELIRKS
jgi:adenylate kinase family enzyme